MVGEPKRVGEIDRRMSRSEGRPTSAAPSCACERRNRSCGRRKLGGDGRGLFLLTTGPLVAITAYSEARFLDVTIQLGVVAYEVTRLVLIQILLTSKGISLNPITLLYYVAPCCMVVRLVPWALVEIPILRDKAPFCLDIIVFSTNSFCTFALNLVVFLLVGKTSALTINVVGVVKDWLLIDFSWSVIRDTITTINLLGYGVAFIDVVYYNHAKLHALKAKEL
ncbi:putative sugar phosphate/phosphate translocator [Canna indica]|uniref:Sugar phosphate/phosphate translocator n=1 Tax=Canna indica TaxID=4628 RepID=A0AAQ3K2R1_9LILI|nr:putative sugar phosphate/phosphate translocator [Canna indica]